MAQDQIETMHHFGHDRFLVAAHDRGARAAHRLCLDHPDSVVKICLMDIVPTLTMYRETNQEFATKYMWWFFLIQQSPLPEHTLLLTSTNGQSAPAQDSQCAVIDISDPLKPTSLVVIHGVRQQLDRPETGTTFLLGNDGLTVIRHLSMEEEYQLEVNETN